MIIWMFYNLWTTLAYLTALDLSSEAYQKEIKGSGMKDMICSTDREEKNGLAWTAGCPNGRGNGGTGANILLSQ